jgi:hypothetical protein
MTLTITRGDDEARYLPWLPTGKADSLQHEDRDLAAS